MNLATVVIGAQWGDEGKGKVVDILAKKADCVVRFNGGNNAGHTIVVKGEKFPLSLLPSGVLWEKHLFISQGVVITPDILINEIEFFQKKGLRVNLMIDPRVNIVMPYHKILDAATEDAKGKKKVGSLKLGIGYCYEDRNNRHGVRFIDLIDEKVLKDKIYQEFPLVAKRIRSVYNYPVKLKAQNIFTEYKKYGTQLKKYLGDVSEFISGNINRKNILFEGAHGTFLDGNFGTYPYTTAVNTISGSVFSHVGFPPQQLNVIGIMKAYTTRVGGGPFPTELNNKIGEYLQEKGNEFGTVSKRRRRCGWLDIVMLRYAERLNGFTELVFTKLDVLTGLEKIKVATHYNIDGKVIREFPFIYSDIIRAKAAYQEFSGWNEDITKARKLADLPKNCLVYIRGIEKMVRIPIRYVSVGSEREAIIRI